MRATIDYAKIDSTSLAAELLLLSPDLQECLKVKSSANFTRKFRFCDDLISLTMIIK